MWVEFYKVNEDARKEYSEACVTSTIKTRKNLGEGENFNVELNRKIRKCANLGKEIDRYNGYVIKQYFDLLFTIKDYTIVCIRKANWVKPYFVTEEEKYNYYWLEAKRTRDNGRF